MVARYYIYYGKKVGGSDLVNEEKDHIEFLRLFLFKYTPISWINVNNITSRTYDVIVATNPSTFQQMWAEDVDQLLFYTTNTALGVNGWVVIG